MGAGYARHIEPAKFWKRENSGSMVERERLVPVGGGNALHGRWWCIGARDASTADGLRIREAHPALSMTGVILGLG